MKLDNKYEVRIVVVEQLPNGSTGDIDNDLTSFKKEHRNSSYFLDL